MTGSYGGIISRVGQSPSRKLLQADETSSHRMILLPSLPPDSADLTVYVNLMRSVRRTDLRCSQPSSPLSPSSTVERCGWLPSFISSPDLASNMERDRQQRATAHPSHHPLSRRYCQTKNPRPSTSAEWPTCALWRIRLWICGDGSKQSAWR